ncbi:MAG: hypothetical protein KDI63_15775 [Gammaproteobacteria bacterium]|nr:hypothetical protein [Gammaproteobacteria bacterium]
MSVIESRPAWMLPFVLLVTACAGMPEGSSEGPPLYVLMSERDKALADQAAQEALEYLQSGKVLRWENPQSGNSGIVVPERTYYQKSQRKYCREYREIITVGNRSERYSDIACRNNKGNWVSAS